ncbi:MAG: thioredoxin [Verrucomicrobiae bacterium]|nr:thioredoxin [Verrucomicrobiae bacterium]
MQNLVVTLDAKSFRAALKQEVLLVDFWEPWCGPCQIQLPVLEEVAHRVAGKATVGKVNVDEAQKLALRFGIQSIPTLVLFKHGKIVRYFVGSYSATALAEAIEAVAESRTSGNKADGHTPRRMALSKTS